MSPTENDFVPWEKHLEENLSFKESPKRNRGGAPYNKDEILAYIASCLEKMEEQVQGLDLKAESGFYWLPFSKLELQFYSIRHIMEHTGELGERLGSQGEVEIEWVGTV